MRTSGNTIFITGGGSGIGRGLAIALERLGNTIIIGGRRHAHLEAVRKEHPGIATVHIDITDEGSIKRAAAKLVADYPALNVLINNAGIMLPDQASGPLDDAQMVATITTNLMGSIRMSSALIEHLKTREDAVIAYTSSVLGFVPLAATAVYSATKAALHSYALSQRFMLRGSNVSVLEIIPPWVRTDLMNSQEAAGAMPLDEFINQTIALLDDAAGENVVEAAKTLRANPGPDEHQFVTGFNEHMARVFAGEASD